MTLPVFIAYLVVASIARSLLHRVTPNADAYLLVGLVAAFVVYAAYRRSRLHGLLDLWRRSDDEQREALLPAVADALGMKPQIPFPAGDEVVAFRYPPASRGFLTMQFWFCAVFGAALLGALARSPSQDSSSDWIQFILGALFALTASLARRQLRWAGQVVTVNNHGLRVVQGRHQLAAIPWKELRAIQQRRPWTVLRFIGSDERELLVWPTLRDFPVFTDLVLRRVSSAPDTEPSDETTAL